MNLNGVVDTGKSDGQGRSIFTRKCPLCGKEHSVALDLMELEEGLAAYQNGAKMQDAFPNFSPEEREFFMSGICPTCWDSM